MLQVRRPLSNVLSTVAPAATSRAFSIVRGFFLRTTTEFGARSSDAVQTAAARRTA
jgi:hypothetical protein